jgi:RNA polymerase sigma-70 factor, ECF subfamily
MTAPDIVRQIHVEGQLKWPSIQVTLEDLWRHCQRICDDSSRLAKARSCAADVYLCCACANGEPVALAMFESESERVVRGAIARVNREPEFIADTLQEFWKKFLVGPGARVHDYWGRAPLHAWLHLCATRLAIDRQRARRAELERATDLGEDLVDQVFDAESTLTRAQFYLPFRCALRQALASMTHRDRALLRLHVVERCSIDQIGRAYNVHRATAARWLQRILADLLQSVRNEVETQGPHLTDSEFQSVARLVSGDLAFDVSLFTRGSVGNNFLAQQKPHSSVGES